jgi:arginine kinase
MLSAKFLTDDIRTELSELRSQCGFTLEDVVRSGVDNPDSNIGAYAGDEDCYGKFSALFDPIIEAYHGFLPEEMESRDEFREDACWSDLNFSGDQVVSTRIRLARNVKEFAFPPALSASERLQLEQLISSTLADLGGDLAGIYFPLADMSEATQADLTANHFLFKKGDRFLESAGINRDWPTGRGIFHSSDKKFLVWVNEEDHLRIISMQKGGDLGAVFTRLRRGIESLEKRLTFAWSEHLGFLTSCPTNLGTAMRASVHVKLPQLGQCEDFQSLCEELQLSVRGVHGEHSDSVGGVWDISNKQRLGVTEIDCLETLHGGVMQLLELEKKRGPAPAGSLVQ